MTASTAPDYTSRLQKVREAIREPELDGLLILGPANRRYLSGYTAADGAIGESSGAVLVTQDRAALLVPAMYLEQARQESVLEPVGLKRRNPKLVTEILAEWGIRRLGFEKDFTVYSYYERLKENLSEGGEMIPVGGIVEELRRRKDPAEQQTMRDAARIADEAFTSVLSTIEPGVTERHMARSIDARMLELGADLPAFETIVAAGTNSARPHHEPGSTVIRAGDPVIVDMGARYNGYCSDMTRSFCLGRADDRYIQLHSIVLEAQVRSAGAIREGLSGKDADAVARDLLTEAGFKDEFCHSLGHGVGLDVHESPGLNEESEDTLLTGMVVTVEPGIYISGWGGIRIEDTVVVSGGAHEVLNHSPKESVI